MSIRRCCSKNIHHFQGDEVPDFPHYDKGGYDAGQTAVFSRLSLTPDFNDPASVEED
jgi:hypothetical protein